MHRTPGEDLPMMSLWKNSNSSLILIVTKEQCVRFCRVFSVPNGMTSGSKNMNSVPAFFFLASQVIMRKF